MFKITLISKIWLFLFKGHHIVPKLDTLLGGTGHIYIYIYVMPTRMEEAPKVAPDIHCLRLGGGAALTSTIN